MPITRGHFWATLEPLSSPSGEEVFWKDEWGTLGPTSSSPYLGSEHVHQAIGGSVEGSLQTRLVHSALAGKLAGWLDL